MLCELLTVFRLLNVFSRRGVATAFFYFKKALKSVVKLLMELSELSYSNSIQFI
jgi:hypothetical protein